jgi:hypothetical protein
MASASPSDKGAPTSTATSTPSVVAVTSSIATLATPSAVGIVGSPPHIAVVAAASIGVVDGSGESPLGRAPSIPWIVEDPYLVHRREANQGTKLRSGNTPTLGSTPVTPGSSSSSPLTSSIGSDSTPLNKYGNELGNITLISSSTPPLQGSSPSTISVALGPARSAPLPPHLVPSPKAGDHRSHTAPRASPLVTINVHGHSPPPYLASPSGSPGSAGSGSGIVSGNAVTNVGLYRDTPSPPPQLLTNNLSVSLSPSSSYSHMSHSPTSPTSSSSSPHSLSPSSSSAHSLSSMSMSSMISMGTSPSADHGGMIGSSIHNNNANGTLAVLRFHRKKKVTTLSAGPLPLERQPARFDPFLNPSRPAGSSVSTVTVGSIPSSPPSPAGSLSSTTSPIPISTGSSNRAGPLAEHDTMSYIPSQVF